MIIPIVVSSHGWLCLTHVSTASRKQTRKRIGLVELPVISRALFLALSLWRPFTDPIIWRGLIGSEIQRLSVRGQRVELIVRLLHIRRWFLI